MSVLNIAFTSLSILGNEFIKRRNSRGYWFWLIGNGIGVAMFAMQQQWLLVTLYGYFAVSCVQGLVNWNRLQRQES